jgi:phospho-N-acetylmuramoyl-pentapeptide-transferase
VTAAAPVALAFALTLGLSAALGAPLIRLLRHLAYRQHAYEDAPKSHQGKTGTPTMGGLLFLLAPLVAAAIVHDALAFAYAFLIAGSAAIGFIDDYASIRQGRNRGLRARTKFLATALVGAIFLGIVTNATAVDTTLLFAGAVPLWLWYALSLAVILATTHAVNLTDGLDGLASGTIVPPLVVLAFLAARLSDPAIAVTLAATLGAVLGFLIYNRHPAKMFMGDTGSLALGAALAGGAILTGSQLLLPLIGGVFVAETLSVIVQVTSYKTTKKRVFRMSPLHHHFELGGWPETTVTARFWLASLVLGVIGLAIVVRA